jgi:hypothetical protein
MGWRLSKDLCCEIKLRLIQLFSNLYYSNDGNILPRSIISSYNLIKSCNYYKQNFRDAAMIILSFGI